MRRMHANSLAAYDTTDFGDRERAIIQCLGHSSVPLTAREIAQRLGFSDLNACRPRLTELRDAGHICECGSVKCPVSHKTVATFALNKPVQEVLEW